MLVTRFISIRLHLLTLCNFQIKSKQKHGTEMVIGNKLNKPVRFCHGILLRPYLRNKSYKVLFFGSDEFSMYSLKRLHSCKENEDLVRSLDIVTSSKENCVSKYAQDKKLKVYGWPPNLAASSNPYDIGIVVSFGHLIPKKFLDIFPLGMINVHASLLPRWRGASPIIHTIMNGETETGVTIMQINPHHFDTGNILLQKSCHIDPNELMPSLHHRLGVLGAECLKESLGNLPDYLSKSVAQSDENATFAPRIKPNISIINWEEQPSSHIYNLYRALYSIYELRTNWHKASVKLRKINLISTKEDHSRPGSIEWNRSSKQLIVWCKQGSISVDTLSLGGKSLSAKDFYNGYLSKRKNNEWYFS